LFKTHEYHIQAYELWIPYEKMQSLLTYKNLGFSENGLLLERKDGTENKFAVHSHAKKWIEKIEQART